MLRYLVWLTLIITCQAWAGTPKVASGAGHTIAITSGGSLSTWGNDAYGQLGRGRTIFSTTPVQVRGLTLGSTTQTRRLGGGGAHIWALTDDGTLWTWGFNGYGQLGDGTTTSSSRPIAVMQGVSAVAAGNFFTVAIKSDGTLWSWGRNDAGQLGDGRQDVRALPQKIGTGYKALAAGPNHVIAVKSDNTLWSWGLNDSGQLGNQTFDSVSTPQQIGFGFVAVATGFAHSLAVDIDGGLWSWGLNDQGQLGDGSISSDFVTTIPQQIGTGFLQVAAGGSHSLALDGRNELWSWGANGQGQLGDGSFADNAVPKRRGAFYQSVAAGTDFSLALQSTGGLWSWGNNALGQLGTGSTTSSAQPGKVGANYLEAASGADFVVARKGDGSVWFWGSSSFGLTGNGETTNFPTPRTLGTGYAGASGGWFHTLALKTDGSLWAWGGNDSGQLGIGNKTNQSSARQIGTGYSAVAAGAFHSLAIQSDSSLWSWGQHSSGQLGTGQRADALRPVRVGSGYRSVAAGFLHSVALKNDGSVWTWGSNGSGQLGHGTTEDQAVPMRVGSDVFQAISAGLAHTLALKSSGELWAWGSNEYGQLGVGGTETFLNVPRRVGTGYTQVVAGWLHSLALKSDGSLWAWGGNFRGQIGNGSSLDANVPARIGSGFTGLSAGGSHSLAIRADGRLWVWGFNDSGQLGDGTFGLRPTPVLAVNANAAGFFSMLDSASGAVPAALNVPFFLSATGDVSSRFANLNTSTKFAPGATGKSGAVFITASVPTGSALAQSATRATAAAGPHPNKAAATAASAFTLIQLTSSGWQTVTNGQLIPYASGVLSDQLAAQTILNGTDTSTLKGAEFCVGYGTTASDMLANGNIRAVATIPGATTTTSCVVGGTLSVALTVSPGWNLLGNPVNQSIAVATQFGDPAKVTSVWKWDSASTKWQFYAPNLSATELQSYAASQGYTVLSEIQAGDGFWVNAKTQADLGTLSGTAINLRQSSLASGWNLVATASAITPQDFNVSLSTTPPIAGQVPINMESLWAWDSAQSKWFFYAPSLEAQGGSALANYLSSQNYKDFTTSGKKLGNAAGFWVRAP
jgi:alpha-tubulin suppressor-like RCC1 family protein